MSHLGLPRSKLHIKKLVFLPFDLFLTFKFFLHLEFISCHMSQESNLIFLPGGYLICSNHLLNNPFLPTDLTCISFLLVCNNIITNLES